MSALPAVTSDFYDLEGLLADDDRAPLHRVRVWARELMGGNGILLDNHVGRYIADAEAIYSYEGTREVNTLIVGRAITGTGAIV